MTEIDAAGCLFQYKIDVLIELDEDKRFCQGNKLTWKEHIRHT